MTSSWAGERLRCERASDEGREHLEPRATLRANLRIFFPDFRAEPRPVALSHPDELALLVLLIDGNHVRRRALLFCLDPPEPSPECYCLTVVESAP